MATLRACAGPGCTTVFQPVKSNQLYCSRPCKDRANRHADAARRPKPTRAEPPRRRLPPPAREKTGIPKVTVVLAALVQPCPECGKPYDDGARLDHHRRVAHDVGFVVPPHEVAVGDVWHAEKVG